MGDPSNSAGARAPCQPAPIVIVGAGLAGLYCALKLAPHRVTVISPAPLGDAASSAWAQGGMAAAVGLGDTADAHAADTIAAGAGLVDEDVALGVARDATGCVFDLLDYGVPFDRDASGGFVQSREAAHSAHRVVRVAGDMAGKAIMEALIRAVRSADHIEVVEGVTAERLVSQDGSVTGLTVAPSGPASSAGVQQSWTIDGVSAVVLATGGVGGLYRVSTNPLSSTGRGVAMAARAGAVIADAEFVQFHPTAIDVDIQPAPLASEALRGEGARLVNRDGTAFMADVHPAGDLAPRDVVARAVFREIADGRGAFLDCRDAIGDAFATLFPTVFGKCREAGIDPVRDLIPVAPAEHYHMGGVRTDAVGRTNVGGLYAIGEVACTGLHGANRLASNSLIEAVVFAARTAADIAADTAASAASSVRIVAHQDTPTDAPSVMPDDAQRRIQALMADHVGVVRTGQGLKSALDALMKLQAEAAGQTDIENMAITARFIAEAALRRRECRGAHWRSDCPEATDAAPKRTTITLAGLELRNAAVARAALGDAALG